MKFATKIALIATVIGLPVAAYAATQHSNHDEVPANAPAPKISAAQAAKIASVVLKGPAPAGEYEKEDGTWRWSFEAEQAGRVHEVGVDAMTGKVVEDAWEDGKDAD